MARFPKVDVYFQLWHVQVAQLQLEPHLQSFSMLKLPTTRNPYSMSEV